MGKKWGDSVVLRSFSILATRDRWVLALITLAQTLLNILDLLAIALTGILGSITVTGVSGRSSGDRVTSVLRTFGLTELSAQQQVTILALTVAILLIFKTLCSAFLVRRTIRYMSLTSASISTNLMSKVLQQHLTKIQSSSMQETLFNVTAGVQSIVMGVLNSLILLISDVSLLVVLIFGLFVVEPTVALSTLVIFSTVALLLYLLMQSRATRLGKESRDLTIQINESILQILNSYREIVVRNRRGYFSKHVGSLQTNLAHNRASSAFLPYVSKYVIEVTMVLGSFFIAGLQFLISDATRAISVLMVFLVASMRIAPAILRLQTGALGFKQTIGGANPTLDLIETLKEVNSEEEVLEDLSFDHDGFISTIELTGVSMSYPNSDSPTLKRISLDVKAGTVVAIVGPSGAGKSTLIDVILGIRAADEGKVRISGMSAFECYKKWPGAVAYVPQDSVISNQTIKENVALGFSQDAINDSWVWDALEISQLKEFVNSLPDKLETPVGDRGTRLSGGQKQRLGIARAMYTKPKLLILDEATSSLDGITENSVTNSISSLKGEVTLVVIAHRLTTVKEADEIFYLNHGELVASGTFEEIRAKVPDFDQQAQLMGL